MGQGLLFVPEAIGHGMTHTRAAGLCQLSKTERGGP